VSPALQWVPWALVPHLPGLRLACRPTVLCSTTTARRPSRPASLGAGGAIPGLLPPFVSRLRLANGRKPHVRARALGHPVPLLFREIVSRRRLALPSSRVTPLMTCPALRPRWCPVCLAIAPPGLLPSGHCKPSAVPSIPPRDILSDHNYTHFGAPSRGLSPCSPSLRAAITGGARRVRS
jgi:hypothetical protein